MDGVTIAKVVGLTVLWIVSLVTVAIRSRSGERAMWRQVAWSSGVACVMVLHIFMI